MRCVIEGASSNEYLNIRVRHHELKTPALIAREIRDEYVRDFGVHALAGHCEGAAGDLAASLDEAGYDAWVVFGTYAHPMTHDGVDHPHTGHCWVVVNKTILDPTREQFGSKILAVGPKDQDYDNYNEHSRVKAS